MLSWTCRLLVLVFSLLLAACATPGASRSAGGLELDLAAGRNDGFVVIKVVALRPISLLSPKWRTIDVTHVALGRKYPLDDVSTPFNLLAGTGSTESLYFARLPAGDYEITGFDSVPPAGGLLLAMMFTDATALGKALPSFKVLPGRLANLGTLIHSPAIDKDQPEKFVLLDGPLGRAAALEDLLAETGKPSLELPQDGGWPAGGAGEDGKLAEARSLVSMFTSLSPAADGQPARAGTHLGQLLERTAPGTWARHSLGGLTRVTSITHSRNGTLLAGGDHGRYFAKEPGGAWVPYRLPAERGTIVHAELLDDGSLIFLANQGMKTRVLAKGRLGPQVDDIRQAATLDSPANRMLVRPGHIFLAWNEPGISREAVIWRVEKRTQAIATQRVKFWVMDWSNLSNGDVHIVRMNGMTLYNTVSRDNLATFAHSDSFGRPSLWATGDVGFGLGSVGGFNTVANQLEHTSDGGKTWVKVGVPFISPVIAGRLLLAQDNEVVVQSGGVVLSTVDQGKTWKQTFPPSPSR